MNKFYISITLVLIGVFIGIFYITQQDTIKKMFFQYPTPAIPGTDQANLELTLLTPKVGQENALNKIPTKPPVVPTFGVEEGLKATYSATIVTSKGDIVLTIFGQYAPNTVKNFIDKADKDFYKNLTFHRVEDWVIQGGDPKGDGTGGGLMQTEINQLPFETGSVGVARGGDIRISNDSQFFIAKSEASWLNGQYTNFGKVESGMSVVNKIEKGDKILDIIIE